MPGNEIGDRVHNFFPQGNLPQELHLSPALGSNWPVSSDSPWAGSQRQVSLGSSNVKNYNLQQPDGERGQTGNHLRGQNDFPQLTLRPEFGNNQSPAQPSNVNGFWDRDTNYNHHNLGSRGLLNYGSQQASAPDNQTKSSVRAGNPGSSLGFDLFGGQQPMNNQQLSMLQSLRHQLSGNDMQQLQQQVMFMKMQELQRQQQLQQVDVQQQQNAMNHIPSFPKQASGSHFLAMNNGSQNADGPSNNLANELGTNRLQRSSPSLQGSSYMLAFSPNHSPAQSAVDVPKQNEQSLYGVPVSGSRGVLNQYSHMTTDNRPAQQQASFGNAILGNQFNASPSQLNAQNGNSPAKQRFHVENSFGSASGQAPSPARAENFQQPISLQRNSPQEEFHRMQRDVVQDNMLDTTEMQNTSSQADVALDPTEERILFGSDDNIWSAFGKNQEDGNAFDGGAFSALMQSAVAETSGSDSGLKEEGSGLNFQLGNEHVRASNDGGRQAPFAGGNSAMSSSLNSEFGTGSYDTNMNKNYQKVLGFQQFGGKSQPGSGPVPHANSPQGLGHSSQEGGQWSNGIPAHNFLAEASMVHRNSAHSLDADFGKNVPGSWRPENLGFQRTSSKQDGSDAFGSVNYRDGDVMVHGEGNSLQHPWGNDRAQAMQREVPHVGAPWTLDSAGDPNVQVKLSGRNAQVNNDGFGENNHSKILDSSTMRTGQGISSSYPVNNWKFVDPLVNSKVNETVKNPQHDNSPLYNDPSKGNEMENSDNQENSNDSRRSSLSHHASAGGPRKNVYSDAVDSRTKSTTMHKYNQTDLTNSASHKSHNYPMGDLGDVEPSRGMKQPLHSQSTSHFSQPKFFGQMPNFVEMGKGQPLDNQRSTKAFNEVLSHPPSNVMASLPNMPSPFNRIGDTKATNMASMSSQNMLELLHKVDQSGEHGAATHTGSSHPSSSSELPPAEKSDGSVGQLQRSLSSQSQGFNLQLGPPQRHSIPNHALTSQNFMQVTNSTHSSYGAVDTGHDGSSSVPASVHIMPSSKIDRSGVMGQLGNDVHKVPGNFNSSFHSRDQVQTLETVSGSGQVSRSSEKEASNSAQKWDPHVRPSSHPSAETSLPNEAGSFLDNNALSGNASVEYGANLPDKVSGTLSSVGGPIPGSLPTSIAGLTSQGPSKALSGSWTNIVAQQHLLGHQFRKPLPQSFQTLRGNSDSLAYMNQLDQDASKREPAQTEFANGSANAQGYGPEEEQSIKGGTRQQVWPEYTNLAQKENASHGKMPYSPAHSDGAPANSLSTQSDIEAFGRSLKPNHFQQNLSMLNPLRGMPVLDKDPSQLIMRGMKGQNDIPGVQMVAPMARLPDDCSEMASDATVPLNSTGHSGDTNISFSGPTNNAEKNPSLEHGNATAQGLLAFGHMVSQGSNDSAPVDHSQISRQMAPSLFNQYEAFRNEQISSLNDLHRGAIAKSTEQPLSAADIGVNKVACIQQSAPLSCTEHISSQILPIDVGDQHPVVLSAKKRKSVASEPIPWCKEVSQGSENIQTISMAEVEWSKAVNRLSQKVEEDVEFLNDGPPFIRSKRRLILTTQLMQQLLRPPPPAILSMDANSDYESVAYSVSRLALGEACNMVAPTNEESNTSTDDGMNRLSGECKTSDLYLLKAAEEFTARARKLESDFSRVCKGASLVDMFVDYQDVEKFSTINRFAKFYGRGQAENAETASSSSDAAANMQQQILCPQRYVTAIPLPRSFPTGVQCHSL